MVRIEESRATPVFISTKSKATYFMAGLSYSRQVFSSSFNVVQCGKIIGMDYFLLTSVLRHMSLAPESIWSQRGHGLGPDQGKTNDADIPGSATTDSHAGTDYTDQKIAHKEASVPAVASSDHSDDEKLVDPNEQCGVQLVEAMTTVWTTRDLIMAYHLDHGVHPELFIRHRQHINTLRNEFIPNALLNRNSKHHLQSDRWNFQTALCQNYGYLGPPISIHIDGDIHHFFYNVGYNGIDFAMTIFIADTSKLRNRAFMIASASSPWLAVTWCYGPAADSILKTIGFRWEFGIWAIVLPITCSPLYLLFVFNQRKAKKMGMIPDQPSHGTALQTVMYYAREFDVIGLLLISAGMALFLLSFSLYSYQRATWQSALIICFIVIGGLLIIAFAPWEK
ncbi:MFS siderochrome iron transporter 1 [Exophiala dermatitidis]